MDESEEEEGEDMAANVELMVPASGYEGREREKEGFMAGRRISGG